MNNTYYRITYNSIGIYESLKKYLIKNNKIEIWNELKNSNYFNWLKVPNRYSEKCLSYFTEDGFNIFKEKTLPLIKKYLDEKDINIYSYDIDISNENVIYQDENQIVIEC